MTCKFCAKERVSQLAYEDGVYAHLIEKLEEATCWRWYRSHPDFRRPDGKVEGVDVRDEPYGLVWIESWGGLDQTPDSKIIESIESGEDGKFFCVEYDTNETITVGLYTYRESGLKIRAVQPDNTLEAHRSSLDVLRHLNITLRTERNPFDGDVLDLEPSTSIESRRSIINEVWENWAVSIHTARICSTQSYAAGDVVVCVEDCEGNPLCIEKTYPEC